VVLVAALVAMEEPKAQVELQEDWDPLPDPQESVSTAEMD
jgi:hypothetical protein